MTVAVVLFILQDLFVIQNKENDSSKLTLEKKTQLLHNVKFILFLLQRIYIEFKS